MFTATFYSFKGGVGRTMALVNVGTWLARHGRRVLLVDFDLEAPGIESYALPAPQQPKKGVVDYVHEMKSGTPPKNFSDYYYESVGVGQNGGALYVMPAGRPDTYKERLERLDLLSLYEQGEGFLIFENLKGLWKSELAPDYVFIDSRTGYNEVAGICTRQLPDAVVVVFTPNKQNIAGLKDTVQRIRNQNKEDWKSPVKLFFLPSNLPVSDDGELSDALERARHELQTQDYLGMVKNYPSPLHLGQTVFTYQRESSTLAGIYASIAQALTEQNIADSDGASRLLEQLLDRSASSFTFERLDEKLQSIEETHVDHADVMFLLARVRLRQGLDNEALVLLDNVLERDADAPEPRLLRANLRLQRGQLQLAEQDLRQVLANTSLHVFQVSQAVMTLRRIDEGAASGLPSFPSYKNLSPEDQALILLELAGQVNGLGLVAPMLEDLSERVPGDLGATIKRHLVLNDIQSRRFRSALKRMGATPTEESHVSECFNYAMARWGQEHTPPRELFELVVHKHTNAPTAQKEPNYLQCIALSYAAIGEKEEAERHLAAAKHGALRIPRPLFSCWTYSVVTRDEFVAHLTAMQQEVGETLQPPAVV